MNEDMPEAVRLLQEALSGPPGVSEVTTQSGRRVRVERDPEPGIQVRLAQLDSEGPRAEWRALSVDAVEERPESYPADLPFLPGVEALLFVFGDAASVTWRPTGASCPVPPKQPDESLAKISERLREIHRSSEGDDSTTRAEVARKVKEVLDSLDPETRGKLEDMWQQMEPEEEILCR
jgi:hypothetical protein